MNVIHHERPETMPPSIFNTKNPYGYKINVNHPKISYLYDRYKRWKGIYTIPSDEQRLEFEEFIISKLKFKEDQR